MINDSKTLVILSPAFPASESEDTWVVSQQLFVKTVKHDFPELNVVVLSFFYPYHNLSYKWNGVEVISFNGKNERKFKRLFLWRNIWRQLNHLRKNQNILGIFSFWCGECALIGRYFGAKYGITHLCWICGQDARETNKWVKFIRPSARELVAMSPSLSEEFYRNHRIKPGYIIPNAIESGLYANGVESGRDIDILGVGSFEIPKQYDVFVEVIASLKTSFPSLRSYHSGMGPESENVEALSDKLLLKSNLTLLGPNTHKEVIRLMRRTKVFLHPSLYEGFSTVCLEALAAGAHVVSFCYPLDKPVKHWHVVNTKEEMISITSRILQNPSTDFTPVRLFTMDESVKAVVTLLGHPDNNIHMSQKTYDSANA